MARVQFNLGLTVIKQQPGLCGPACAQMILHAQGIGIGTSVNEQQRLWDDVKANTTAPPGITTSSNAPDPGDCGVFPRKICECPGRPQPFCWCTFPSALRATLLQHSPGVNVRVITSVNEDSIQAKIIACLEHGSAPAVLVLGGIHWVVVGGYDSERETQIKLFDPNPDFISLREVTLENWVTNYLVAPTCGKYDGKYVVVGRDS